MSDQTELREKAIAKFSRDQHGLLPNVEYQFEETGAIDWRKLVSDKFLYPNKEWFASRQKEAPTSIEGLKDNQLLIMLGGIRELAKIRGFESVSFEVIESSDERAVVTCKMYWSPNFENPDGMNYSEVANATIRNTDGFGEKFLESIAANRAFVRCVRNFLNVNIVGADEIDKSQGKEYNKDEVRKNSTTPQGSLEKAAKKEGYETFDDFKPIIKILKTEGFYTYDKENNKDGKIWETFDDIPAKEARKMLSGIKKWSKVKEDVSEKS